MEKKRMWSLAIEDFGAKSMKNGCKMKNFGNGICPKKMVDLTKKLKDKEFVRLQNRRGQTEKISILKKNSREFG